MVLTNQLKAFKNQQQGIVAFTRPDGVRVDLSHKRDCASTTKWILKLFDGDEEAASGAVAEVMPQALTRADAPWPYLLTALQAKAQRRRAALPAEDLNPVEVHNKFVGQLGMSRLWLYGSIVAAQPLALIDGIPYHDSVGAERAATLTWLMGDDPYVLYSLLSPQAKWCYVRSNGLQLLVDDVQAARIAIESMDDPSTVRKGVLDFLDRRLRSCHMDNEFKFCLNTIRVFYAKVEHPVLLIVKLPRYKRYLPLDGKQAQGYLTEFIEKNRYVIRDTIRGGWLRSALRLGVVTRPVEWLMSTIHTKVDPTVDWCDSQWYNDKHMINVFGLRITSRLFPSVMVKHA